MEKEKSRGIEMRTRSPEANVEMREEENPAPNTQCNRVKYPELESDACELPHQKRERERGRKNALESKCHFSLWKLGESIQNANVNVAVPPDLVHKENLCKGSGVGLGKVGLSLKLGLQICFNHSLS